MYGAPRGFRRQAKKAGLLADNPAGDQAHRIPIAKANRCIARTWPGAPLIKEVPPATSPHHPSDDLSLHPSMSMITSDYPLDSIPDEEREKLQALVYADCMANQGRLDDAIKLAEPNFYEGSLEARRILARIQMLKAARDGDWAMGIARRGAGRSWSRSRQVALFPRETLQPPMPKPPKWECRSANSSHRRFVTPPGLRPMLAEKRSGSGYHSENGSDSISIQRSTRRLRNVLKCGLNGHSFCIRSAAQRSSAFTASTKAIMMRPTTMSVPAQLKNC